MVSREVGRGSRGGKDEQQRSSERPSIHTTRTQHTHIHTHARTHTHQVLFQGFYTTVFGWYETLVFLRTGSFAAPVAVHAFCNWMGVPEFDRMARQRGSLALTAVGVGLFVSVFPTAMRLMTPTADWEAGQGSDL